MRIILIAAIVFLGLAAMTPSASAMPFNGNLISALETEDLNELQEVRHRRHWRRGGCRYKFKVTRWGYKEVYECKRRWHRHRWRYY
jgi:hypothetical protein